MAERETLFACAVVDADGTIDAPRFLRAADAESAACEYAATRSVLTIRTGAVVSVWRLGNFPTSFHAQYDGDPMLRGTGIALRLLGNPPLPEIAS